jgi:hypothetical protein
MLNIIAMMTAIIRPIINCRIHGDIPSRGEKVASSSGWIDTAASVSGPVPFCSDVDGGVGGVGSAGGVVGGVGVGGVWVG